MDEMRINSQLMKDFFANIVKEVIKNKTGCEVEIQLSELSAEISEGMPKVHLSLDAGLNKDEFERILKKIPAMLGF